MKKSFIFISITALLLMSYSASAQQFSNKKEYYGVSYSHWVGHGIEVGLATVKYGLEVADDFYVEARLSAGIRDDAYMALSPENKNVLVHNKYQLKHLAGLYGLKNISLNKYLDLYAKLGINHVGIKDTTASYDMKEKVFVEEWNASLTYKAKVAVGLGLHFNLTPKVAITIEAYAPAIGRVSETTEISAGYTYRF